jgi:hypothetical protein
MCQRAYKSVAVLFVCGCLCSCAQLDSRPGEGASAQQQVIPEPRFDRIDYYYRRAVERGHPRD